MTSLYLGRHLFQLSQNRTRDLQERNFPGLDTEPNYIDPIDKTLSGIQNNQHANTIIKDQAATIQLRYSQMIVSGARTNTQPISEARVYAEKQMYIALPVQNVSVNKIFAAILNRLQEVIPA